VLTAESAETALKLNEEHQGPLELLVTDVVMTGMDGPALAARLARLRPEMQTLFMSGYSGEHVLALDRLEGRAAFLAKPFTPTQLIAAVTALLVARVTSAAQQDPAARA
jgi:DNA-binding NtrC family response regulator